jgi:hypothetical protein
VNDGRDRGKREDYARDDKNDLNEFPCVGDSIVVKVQSLLHIVNEPRCLGCGWLNGRCLTELKYPLKSADD